MGTEGEGGRHLPAGGDAAGGEHRDVVADRVDDLGHEDHRGDLAAVAAGLRALGDDDVDALGDLPLGVLLRPHQRADDHAGVVRGLDDVGRRRPERVHEHLHARMRERDLDLTRRLRVDVQARGLDDAAVELGGQFRDVVTLEELFHEIAVRLRDHRVEVGEVRFVPAARSLPPPYCRGLSELFVREQIIAVFGRQLPAPACSGAGDGRHRHHDRQEPRGRLCLQRLERVQLRHLSRLPC